jgi:hypothetical protein
VIGTKTAQLACRQLLEIAIRKMKRIGRPADRGIRFFQVRDRKLPFCTIRQ